MARRPRTLSKLAPLRRAIAHYRDAGERVALVPTMGALHAGHLALVRRAQRRARRVVVSIFVNPAQFAPHEDFSSYPRPFQADVALLARERVDLVWAPTAQVVYPTGFATRIVPEGAAQVGLEDQFRPHFFGGVATVVLKLLLQTLPDFALFGEKDYQQLKVVTQLARDLDLPTAIVGVPVVRDTDGLALSSRNAYLTPAERAVAPTLYRVLRDSAAEIAAGRPIVDVMAVARARIEKAGFAIDYVEARHAETLQPIHSRTDGPVRLLAAARLGKTRLIDNVPA
jgi:pantoate--beta-alanine ligase